MITRADFERLVGPLEDYAACCHEASLALVKAGVPAGLLPLTARVARGSCNGVGGQHSWVVLDGDCYDPEARIVDPTLWSYTREEPYVWNGGADDRPHVPHGTGSIWEYGRPDNASGEIIELAEPEGGWSPLAATFLDLLGPLDRRGWAALAHAPAGGWPAAEILGAMWQDERIGALIPIDIVGMVTDLNPNGLYLPTEGER